MTNWTTSNIPDLTGKFILVTGANSGVGYETALALSGKGATVGMACRNMERASQAVEKIKALVPQARLDPMELDLASMRSISGFVAAFRSRYDRLDVLINNGGPVIAGRIVTRDGLESHFGINHIGHFALTGLLLNVLLKTPGSRIVTLGSRMHANARINWKDLNSEAAYDSTAAYAQSKLANMLFAFELSRRLEAGGKTTLALAAHPGLANTAWAENDLSGPVKLLGKIMSQYAYQSAAMGALPVLYAAVDPNVKAGGYYGPEGDTQGYPVEVRAHDKAYNEADGERLWELSENLTGVTFAGLSG